MAEVVLQAGELQPCEPDDLPGCWQSSWTEYCCTSTGQYWD